MRYKHAESFGFRLATKPLCCAYVKGDRPVINYNFSKIDTPFLAPYLIDVIYRRRYLSIGCGGWQAAVISQLRKPPPDEE